MSLPYDVVATDLDGTVVRRDGTVSDRTRAALTRVAEAGATVVLVTGRPPRWLAGISEATGHRGLAICANGALVYDLATDRVVESHPLTPAIARRLVEELRSAIPGLGFAVESVSDGFAHESSYRPQWDAPEGANGPRVVEVEELLELSAVKLLARHPSYDADELLAAAREVVTEDVATLTHSSFDGLLEVSAAGVSKATALARLCEELGVPSPRVVAFGDMPNDLPMLAWAGHSVAVANAHAEVLEAVDEVTASVADDGVAQVLERLFAAPTEVRRSG